MNKLVGDGCFQFKLVPDYSQDQDLIFPDFVEKVNPEKAPYHYGIRFYDYSRFVMTESTKFSFCLTIHGFKVKEGSDKKNDDRVKYCKTLKVMVFRTYYPLTGLFFQILQDLLKSNPILLFNINSNSPRYQEYPLGASFGKALQSKI